MQNLTEILTAQIRSINDRYVATIRKETPEDSKYLVQVRNSCMAQIETVYEIATAAGIVRDLRESCFYAKRRIWKNADRAYHRMESKSKSAA